MLHNNTYRVSQKFRSVFDFDFNREHNLHMICTGCPKSLGHFLRPFISKTTMHDVKFETYLERENSGNYSDTKFTGIAFCDENLHVKEIVSTKQHYHTK